MSNFSTGLLSSLSTLANRQHWSGGAVSGMSNRQLADTGIQREDAPRPASWRQQVVASIRSIADQPSPARQAYRRAVRELQMHSDAELAELGISRHGIEDAVRYGRPGIDV